VALGVLDHAGQHLGDAGGVADLLLVGDHVAEQRHLLHLLEAALADGAVGGLRRHEEERRVVPVGGLHGVTRLVMPGPFWAIIMDMRPVARV
jgi:hypothetical protein